MVRGPGERHGRPPGDRHWETGRPAGARLGTGRAGKAAAVAGVDGAAPPRLGRRPAGWRHGQRPRHQDGAGAGRAHPPVGVLAGRPDPRGHRDLARRPGQADPGGMGRGAGRGARRGAPAVRRHPRPHPPGRPLPARPGAAPGRRDRAGGTAAACPGCSSWRRATGSRPPSNGTRPIPGGRCCGCSSRPAPTRAVLPRLVVGRGPAGPAADRPGRRRAAPAHPARRRRPGAGPTSRSPTRCPQAGADGHTVALGRRLGAEHPAVRRGRAPAPGRDDHRARRGRPVPGERGPRQGAPAPPARRARFTPSSTTTSASPPGDEATRSRRKPRSSGTRPAASRTAGRT